jgi:hypothetical protein
MSGEIIKAGAGDLAPADDVAQGLAKLRLAAVLNEERVIRYGCAQTGARFLIRYRRETPGGLFMAARIEREQPPSATAKLLGGWLGKKKPEVQSFRWDEFDTSGQRCPDCGSRGLTFCDDCQRWMCSARKGMTVEGLVRFHCHPSCGASFNPVPVRTVTAAKADRKADTPQLGGPKHAGALPPPPLRLQGPR